MNPVQSHTDHTLLQAIVLIRTGGGAIIIIANVKNNLIVKLKKREDGKRRCTFIGKCVEVKNILAD